MLFSYILLWTDYFIWFAFLQFNCICVCICMRSNFDCMSYVLISSIVLCYNFLINLLTWSDRSLCSAVRYCNETASRIIAQSTQHDCQKYPVYIIVWSRQRSWCSCSGVTPTVVPNATCVVGKIGDFWPRPVSRGISETVHDRDKANRKSISIYKL